MRKENRVGDDLKPQTSAAQPQAPKGALVLVKLQIAPEDVREVITSAIKAARGEWAAARHYALALHERWPAGDGFPDLQEMAHAAQHAEVKMPLHEWAAELVFTLPARPWRARILAARDKHPYLTVEDAP